MALNNLDATTKNYQNLSSQCEETPNSLPYPTDAVFDEQMDLDKTCVGDGAVNDSKQKCVF